MACGQSRCHSEGGARGQCRGCHYGRLPGWSWSFVPSVCQYKGCTEAAVYAYLPGSKQHCCKVHGDAVIARSQKRFAEQQAKYDAIRSRGPR